MKIIQKNKLTSALQIPMAHAPGKPDTGEITEIMKRYRSGGTPWKVIVDPNGSVVYNNFHLKTAKAVAMIELRTADRK